MNHKSENMETSMGKLSEGLDYSPKQKERKKGA